MPCLAAARTAAQQCAGILCVHLIEALAPAQTLIPRLTEMLRLLIVDDGIAAVADLTAADRTGDGELDILGQQMIIPSRLPRGVHQPKSENQCRKPHS